jgi:cytochrome c peroxidase
MARYICLISFFFLLVAFSATKDPVPYIFPKLLFFPEMPSSPSNPVTLEGADLGRHLFYDSILSADFSMSCATCHKQENAFSDAPNKLTEGRSKVLTTRNTMPLFNLAWYPSYFWDGKAISIEDQVFHPLRDSNEMNLHWNIPENRIRNNLFYK